MQVAGLSDVGRSPSDPAVRRARGPGLELLTSPVRPGVAAVLERSPLLAGATPREREVLGAHASVRAVQRGQVLLLEGERSDHVYAVVSGRFKVFVTSDRGDELVLSLLGPDDHLGEISVLDRLARSATVQARVDSVVLVLPGEPLRALLSGSAPVALAWANALATEVRRLTGSTADLVFLDLPRRLVKLLLESGDAEVDLGGPQAELAARLGVVRQSVNRALSALQQRGWLVVDGPAVVLRDRVALDRFARS